MRKGRKNAIMEGLWLIASRISLSFTWKLFDWLGPDVIGRADEAEVFALFLGSGGEESRRYCSHFSNLSLLLSNSFDSNEDQPFTYTINFSGCFLQKKRFTIRVVLPLI
jgi:hypothetical protein